MSTEFELIRDLLEQSYDESDVYFYHSDHLGSSSFITDGNGDATQHLQYLPFGEDFIHQQSTSAYYSPFTFSGKERDAETSLSYFGARYYDASLSIWLSVDPLSDKYPSLSAYNYCAWNPVMLVDPDGRKIKPAREADREKLTGYLNEQFNGAFYVGSDGWVKTDRSQYRKMMRSNDVSQNTKDLARAFKATVRSSKIAEVYIFENADEVSVYKDPKSWNEQTRKMESIYKRSDGSPGFLIKGINGSATISADGMNTIIIIGNPTELFTSSCFDLNCPNVATDGQNGNCQFTAQSASSIFLHEALDHFYEENIKGGAKIRQGQVGRIKH